MSTIRRFFDKRSKFIHYAPRTAILNNLEFDHADIFENLAAIKRQFHHLVRTVPGNGLVISPYRDSALEAVLSQGLWSPTQQFGVNVPDEVCRLLASGSSSFWNANLSKDSGEAFEVVQYDQGATGERVNRCAMQWTMTGEHNVRNALAAIAAARHVGIDMATSVAALREFEGVKRRMEHLGTIEGVSVYDDFAHHPTAIDTTLRGMAAKMAAGESGGRLIAIIEPRSNTMKLGIHQADLAAATAAADLVLWKKPEKSGIDFHTLLAQSKCPAHAFELVEEIVCFVAEDSAPEDQIVIMSNGGFDNIHQKLLSALGARRAH